MSSLPQTPDPDSSSETAQCHAASYVIAEGKAVLPVKEESRWSDAVKPLPAVLEWLEKRKIAVTILLFAFLALKATVQAKGDIPTALGILQTASPVTTVVGALLSALPLVAVAVLVIVAYRAARDVSLEGHALAFAALLVCAFVTPWPVLAASIVVAPVAGYTMRRRQRLIRSRRPRWRKWTTLFVLIPCLVIFLIIAGATVWKVMYDVWLPHEMITLHSGRVEVGYVLGDNGSWVSILRAGERRLVLYREPQVDERVLCQLRTRNPYSDLTTWQVFARRSWTSGGQQACPQGFRGNP